MASRWETVAVVFGGVKRVARFHQVEPTSAVEGSRECALRGARGSVALGVSDHGRHTYVTQVAKSRLTTPAKRSVCIPQVHAPQRWRGLAHCTQLPQRQPIVHTMQMRIYCSTSFQTASEPLHLHLDAAASSCIFLHLHPSQ
eukprot:796808-Prymnesium_polylepis.1